MFKELGQFASIMKNMGKIKDEAERRRAGYKLADDYRHALLREPPARLLMVSPNLPAESRPCRCPARSVNPSGNSID